MRDDEIMESHANTSFLTQLGWSAEFSIEKGVKNVEYERLMNRIIRMLGVDKAIRYVIFGKIISVLTGLLLIMLISHYLSKDAQGYYYTFNSVVALQIIFELGLSTVIIQFASHEMSALKYDYSERDIIGESKNKQRYLSLFRLAIKWYAVIALLIILIVGPIGYVFTQKKA